MKVVTIYTDGACKGNPGPGGWGALLSYGGAEKEMWGGEHETTNNRMEIMAAIESLECLKRPSKVVLYTDSEYLRKGITEWIHGWMKRNWKNSQGKPVKNAELWQRLHQATQQHDIEWRWVKGHSGDPGNERADQLANRGYEEQL